MKNMLFTRDLGGEQFKKLHRLYVEANNCLLSNAVKYPEYKDIWAIVVKKMGIIRATFDSANIPSDETKREADISIMLSHVLRDINDEDIKPLYDLSTTFTLLGMKDIHFEQGDVPSSSF